MDAIRLRPMSAVSAYSPLHREAPVFPSAAARAVTRARTLRLTVVLITSPRRSAEFISRIWMGYEVAAGLGWSSAFGIQMGVRARSRALISLQIVVAVRRHPLAIASRIGSSAVRGGHPRAGGGRLRGRPWRKPRRSRDGSGASAPQRRPSHRRRSSARGSRSSLSSTSNRMVARRSGSYCGQPGLPHLAKDTHAECIRSASA